MDKPNQNQSQKPAEQIKADQKKNDHKSGKPDVKKTDKKR